jgi:NitT/TauT family transport system permease protein
MQVMDETTTRIKLRRLARRPAQGSVRRWRERLLGIASPVVLLILWEAAARAGMIDVRFFPAPSSIGEAMWTMANSGELETNTWATLHRLFLGFVAGGLPGLALGILMGVYRPFRLVFEPLVAATYPIPKSAICH